jgi:acetyl esterase/lipase
MKLFSALLGVENAKDSAGDRRMGPGNATAEEVKGLPPTTFGIAGNDPLRDEGIFYGKHLAENG